MKSNNIQYIQEVDHLRAFAATLIVMYHGFQIYANNLLTLSGNQTNDWIYTNNPVLALLIEGHTAVGLFMVLSGFILAYGSIDKEINYFNFIKNRFLRIYPLFIFLIITGISIYPNQFSFASLLQTIFGFSNHIGALDVVPFSSMNWAISVEFLFYLVFPFLILFLNNAGYKNLLLLLLTFLLFRLIGLLLGGNPRDFSYWTILGRMDQFIIGILLAYVYKRTNESIAIRKVFKLLLIPSIVIIFSTLFIFNKLGGWPIISYWKIVWPIIEAIIWSIFILSFIMTFSNYKRTKLSNGLASIGVISYSMYLTHMILIHVVTKHSLYLQIFSSTFKNAFLNSIILYLATIIVSCLTYSSIEKPFLNLRKKYINKTT